jgi:hypothetical protein
MSQQLELEIKATSDVDKATAKAKNEVGSLAHAVDAFNRKLKNFGKDLLLSVAGPMILFNRALDYALNAYAEAKQRATDGLELLAEGKSKLAGGGESAMAEFFRRKKQMEEEKKLIAAGKEELARQYLATAEGRRATGLLYTPGTRYGNRPEDFAGLKAVQEQALAAFLKSEEGSKFRYIFEAEKKAKEKEKEETERKSKPKSAENITGNVVGVGASANFTILQSQLEVQKESRDLLRQIATPGRSANPTVKPSATPSR